MNQEQVSEKQTVIAFLGYAVFEDGEAYRGAILVTDEWSKPIEFRCTAPVRPTRLQRTLYGSSLLPHVLTELIAAPLITSAKHQPKLILIAEDAYFDVRYRIDDPVIHVGRPKEANSRQEDQVNGKRHIIQSASGRFDNVQLKAHWKHGCDLECCSDLLRDLFGRWDLTEPFQRISKGLQYVHDEQVLES